MVHRRSFWTTVVLFVSAITLTGCPAPSGVGVVLLTAILLSSLQDRLRASTA